MNKAILPVKLLCPQCLPNSSPVKDECIQSQIKLVSFRNTALDHLKSAIFTLTFSVICCSPDNVCLQRGDTWWSFFFFYPLLLVMLVNLWFTGPFIASWTAQLWPPLSPFWSPFIKSFFTWMLSHSSVCDVKICQSVSTQWWGEGCALAVCQCDSLPVTDGWCLPLIAERDETLARWVQGLN